jgi:uncharacterized LabA/DUF88 family protein
MNSNGNGHHNRQDAVQLVISTMLTDEECDTCDHLVAKSGTSYKDFGLSLRFHRMQWESLTALRRAQEEMPWNFEVHYQTAIQELRCRLPQEAKRSALKAWNQVNQAIAQRGASDYFMRRKSDIARLMGDTCAAVEEDEQASSWWDKSVRFAQDKGSAVVEASRRLVSSGNTERAHKLLSEQSDLVKNDARVSREREEVTRVRSSRNAGDNTGKPVNDEQPRRVAVLVDVANIEVLQREGNLSASLSYETILDLIAPGAQVTAADAFVPDPPEIMDGVGEQLKRLGFTVRPIRSRWQGGRLKADADAAIAAWMMVHIAKDTPDEVWIVSSDEDFAEVVEAAHELRPDVRVCFAGLDQNGHSELARRGDRWLPLPGTEGSPNTIPELAIA